MRLLIVTVAIVMLASFVGVDRVMPTPLQAPIRSVVGGEEALAIGRSPR